MYSKWRWLLFLGICLIGLAMTVTLFYKDFLAPDPQPNLPTQISTEIPVESAPPTYNEQLSYVVPADHPRRVVITAIGVDALIKPIGVLSDGTLGAPATAWEVGWYKEGSLPGNTGAMLFDGHVNDSYNTPGVFAKLKDLKAGNEVTVERGDGTLFAYRVVATEQMAADRVDMSRLLHPISGNQGLNLITCGGSYDKKTGKYSDRILVFTERVTKTT